MKTDHTPPPALAWTPYTLTHIDQPRTGFVGRAAAMRINCVECIVLCKSDDALAMVGATLTDNSFNPEMIYKATLIQSMGIEVEAVEVPVEEVQPSEGPVVAETDGTPVRGDGVPVAEYAAEKTHPSADTPLDKTTVEETASAFGNDDDDEL